MSEEKVYCSMYSRNAELYHHGVKGQKWGVENGPPYPLDDDVSTGKRLKNSSPDDQAPKQKFFESNKKYHARLEAYNNGKNRRYIEKKEKEKKEMQQKINDLDNKLQKIKSEHKSRILERNEELSRIADELLDIEMKPENESIFVYGNVPGGKNQKHTYEDDMNIWYKTTSDGRRYKQLEDQFESKLKIKSNESLKKDTNYQMLLKQKMDLKNEMKKKNFYYYDYMDD